MKRLLALPLLAFAMIAPFALAGCTDDKPAADAKAPPANPNAAGEKAAEKPAG